MLRIYKKAGVAGCAKHQSGQNLCRNKPAGPLDFSLHFCIMDVPDGCIAKGASFKDKTISTIQIIL